MIPVVLNSTKLNPPLYSTQLKVIRWGPDTDPLTWWKQHVQEFPHLVRMVSQYLTVPATSVSPERLFRSVGLVKSD
jgi:hypothetical protein